MIAGKQSIEADKRNAREGRRVVLFANKSWLMMLYRCQASGLYLISQHASVDLLARQGQKVDAQDRLEWAGVAYKKRNAIQVAALAEDSSDFNWREIYRIVRKGPGTNGSCQATESD